MEDLGHLWRSCGVPHGLWLCRLLRWRAGTGTGRLLTPQLLPVGWRAT